LQDLWQETSQRLQKSLPSEEVTVMACLLHDLGYALNSLQWDDKQKIALNHAQQGAQFLDKFKNIFLSVSEGSKQEQNSFPQFVEDHADLLFYIISSDTTGAIAFLQRLQKWEKETDFFDASNIMYASTLLADKLDYFLAERVETPYLHKPQSFCQNPYYFLSQAVHQYRMEKHSHTLQFVVTLQSDEQIFVTDQNKTGDWYQATIEHGFASVWELAQLYASFLGLDFKVVQEKKTSLG
jgi:hypothetical protein